MQHFPGTPSDQVAGALAAGHGDITTAFVSMATRHPDGTDADYLRWHTLDHRPEQHRLSAVRASLRLVSTPECRAARAVTEGKFEAVDPVMTYFFTGIGGLDGFNELSSALGDAGRKLPLLPHVERGVYALQTKVAAARIKAGADVLPWRPILGAYLLIELVESAGPAELVHIDGVAGVWSFESVLVDERLAAAPPGQLFTYCFLDEDPVTTAERLRPVLEQRWNAPGIKPLFAAPFHPVVPYEWDRYVP
jgi:hypothetical protein